MPSAQVVELRAQSRSRGGSVDRPRAGSVGRGSVERARGGCVPPPPPFSLLIARTPDSPAFPRCTWTRGRVCVGGGGGRSMERHEAALASLRRELLVNGQMAAGGWSEDPGLSSPGVREIAPPPSGGGGGAVVVLVVMVVVTGMVVVAVGAVFIVVVVVVVIVVVVVVVVVVVIVVGGWWWCC